MAELMLINPKKRRKKRRKTRTYAKRRRRNPIYASRPRRKTRRSYKRRRNPIRNFGDIMSKAVMPAATAAGGALTLDMIMGFLPIPDNFKTGPMRHFVKGLGAIGMGMLASNFVKSKTAELFTTGALTVTIYEAGKEMLNQYMPNLPLEAYIDDDDDMSGLGYQGSGYPSAEENVMGLGYADNNYDDPELTGMGMSLEDELEI